MIASTAGQPLSSAGDRLVKVLLFLIKKNIEKKTLVGLSLGDGACIYSLSLSLSSLSLSLSLFLRDRLHGLVVKASASRAEDPGFEFRLRRGDFSESSHTSDLKIDSPVVTLPGALRYGIHAGTGWPGVSALGEVRKFNLQLLSQCGRSEEIRCSRHGPVFPVICFMSVHMHTYCSCMNVMYSAVRIPLVSNCAI